MTRYLIYIIDDDATLRKSFRKTLKNYYRVHDFAARMDAVAAMESEPPDLVLLGIGLADADGLDLIRRIRNSSPQTRIIALTASVDLPTVISAMKLGVHDCLPKPIYDQSLLARVRDTLESLRLRKEVQVLQENAIKEQLPCILGESLAIHEIMDIVNRVALSSDTPVLILGETGTGKELIAAAIHYRSPNSSGPFVPINCAAIPATLIESEFFGYERGSFSGAHPKGKKGLVEKAGNGTLFLDEVADLGPEAQAKLLRFLENGEFYRVGATEMLRVRTRIISASNRRLEDLISEGKFRDDLYYRLGVIRIEVPSLNERREDILLLANYYVAQFCDKFQKPNRGLTPQAAQTLQERRWQGNIRELRNVIERAVLLAQGDELTEEDLGLVSGSRILLPGRTKGAAEAGELPPDGVDLATVLESLEHHYIEAALHRSGGNECQAARLLKMNHHTLRYRKKKLGIE
jgi:DNA-binding NtrC family response regulator